MNQKSSLFNKVIKFFGLITVISGVYGVSYQKGMIMAMNLGNLSGNYDVREIFNTATLGYVDIFLKIIRIDVIDLLVKNLYLVVVFAFIGLCCAFGYKKRDNIDRYVSSSKAQFKAFLTKIVGSYWLSTLCGAIIGIVSNFISIFIAYIFLFFSVILILPALVGYLTGFDKIQSIMENPACGDATEEMYEKPFFRQCTQIQTKNNQIQGEILLENHEAYFVYQNDSFLYLKKDKVTCMSSKFLATNIVQDKDDLKFPDNESDKLCQSI